MVFMCVYVLCNSPTPGKNHDGAYRLTGFTGSGLHNPITKSPENVFFFYILFLDWHGLHWQALYYIKRV